MMGSDIPPWVDYPGVGVPTPQPPRHRLVRLPDAVYDVVCSQCELTATVTVPHGGSISRKPKCWHCGCKTLQVTRRPSGADAA